MWQTCGTRAGHVRERERGGSRLNFTIVLALLIIAGYIGYQTVPVFYRASLLQSFMQDTVNNASYLNKNPAWVEQQIRANGDYYGLPPDALIETGLREGRMVAHVQFAHPIFLIVTTYRYTYDQTVKSAALVSGG
jgi:hypothetical protein